MILFMCQTMIIDKSG